MPIPVPSTTTRLHLESAKTKIRDDEIKFHASVYCLSLVWLSLQYAVAELVIFK